MKLRPDTSISDSDINLYDYNLPFHEWKVDFLIDYIINIHHRYIYHAIPILESQLVSLAANKEKFMELQPIKDLISDLIRLLLSHCRHEEEIIFPYIKQIDTAYNRKEPYGNLFVRTLRKPLNTVEKEHGEINDLLNKLKAYTQDFVASDNDSGNQQAFYNKLQEFHKNLIVHERIENNILFPRAIEIESKLLGI